jgi:hypothetical protein
LIANLADMDFFALNYRDQLSDALSAESAIHHAPAFILLEG